MQMALWKIDWERNGERAVGARLTAEVWLEEAKQGHPEQYPTASGEGLGLHLLPC